MYPAVRGILIPLQHLRMIHTLVGFNMKHKSPRGEERACVQDRITSSMHDAVLRTKASARTSTHSRTLQDRIRGTIKIEMDET